MRSTESGSRGDLHHLEPDSCQELEPAGRQPLSTLRSLLLLLGVLQRVRAQRLQLLVEVRQLLLGEAGP